MVRDMRKNITNVCVYICLPSRQEHRQGDGGSEENKKIHRLLMNFNPSPGLSYMSRQAGSLQMSQT